jgi:Acetyltransferases
MEIRLMKSEEAEDVSHIYAKSWKSAYKGIVPQTYLDSIPELRWAPIILKSTADSYVLLEDGKLIGTSSIGPSRDETMGGWGEIVSIYLLPEYFRMGYGKSLFTFDVNELYNRGFRKIFLWVLEKNRAAGAFYEKMGFAKDGAKVFAEIGGENLAEVRYVNKEGLYELKSISEPE